jgi:hypothetical protein
MRCTYLMLTFLLIIASGCATSSDFLVQYQSVAPFHPNDPNELLAELTGRLPADVEIHHFLHQQRADHMRGVVFVRSEKERHAVCDSIRTSQRLQLASAGTAQAGKGARYLICLSSQPPFAPEDENRLCAELQRPLPPDVKITVVRSRRQDDRITLWLVVTGNYGKEAVKYAIYQNPNLKLLQVEKAPPLLFLWLTR